VSAGDASTTVDAAAAPQLRITSRGVSDIEAAAALAVLQTALEETAAEWAAEEPPQSAWRRSQRELRAPLRPGNGMWRRSIG
jgi:sirohydrochlorin ferrochelatase